MTDIELLIQVRGENQNLDRAKAVWKVAAETGQSVKGVSGRVSRAEKTIEGRAALMHWQQAHALQYDKARAEIDALIYQHVRQWEQNKHTRPTGKEQYAVFLTDTHFPYQDVKALELTYKIIDDLPDVFCVSGLSDGFDLSTLSRWPDGRQAKDRAIDGNLRGVLDAYIYHLNTISIVAPDASILGLVGNHDVRLVSGNVGTEDYLQLDVMKRLSDNGMVFLSDFSRENIIQINKGLYWYHGKHARKNRLGSAKANYEHVKHTLDSPYDFTLVFGHVHDPVHWKQGHINSFGAGCLQQLQPHYNRHAQHWQQGIVISKIVDDWNLTYLVNFDMVGGKLKAFNPFNGREYEV